MDTAKTYLPADYATYLLARYAGKNEAEWATFLDEDAWRPLGHREIPFTLCGGKRYYDLWNVYLIISRQDHRLYLKQLAEAKGCKVDAFSPPYARVGFDPVIPKSVGFVELVTQGHRHGKLKMTPDEARSLAVHLFSQADICSCQDYEASEYKDANETAEDAYNALLIEMGLSDSERVCETSKEAA